MLYSRRYSAASTPNDLRTCRSPLKEEKSEGDDKDKFLYTLKLYVGMQLTRSYVTTADI